MSVQVGLVAVPDRQTASWREYLSVARLDHMTKHVFIVPGVMLAYLLRGNQAGNIVLTVLLGLIVAIAIASANYTINEYLDRASDRHHPTKSARAAVQTDMSGMVVFIQWLILFGIGITAGYLAGTTMLITAILFAAQGVIYNVRPMRTKDVPYLDVLSEAVNNPFRLMIGWAMLDPLTLPPASVILAYWFGGAFLMGAKRLSEYREIVASHGKEVLALYRRSFRRYTEINLTASVFVYAMSSIAFLSIFMVKYRIEYVLVLPAITMLFSKYLSLSMLPGSTAQKPEHLFKERRLLAIAFLVGALFVVLTFVNIPALDYLSSQQFIAIHGG
jgi:4-hydroxybenzoate polyprenyltransferase